jgi:hypothetical protein
MLLVATACEHSTKAAAVRKPLEVLVAALRQKEALVQTQADGEIG